MTFSAPSSYANQDGDRNAGRGKTNYLMSKTMAQHVRFDQIGSLGLKPDSYRHSGPVYMKVGDMVDLQR